MRHMETECVTWKQNASHGNRMRQMETEAYFFLKWTLNSNLDIAYHLNSIESTYDDLAESQGYDDLAESLGGSVCPISIATEPSVLPLKSCLGGGHGEMVIGQLAVKCLIEDQV
ncbi:hypothetical protein Btru_076701 [Bulinus truncatus]|nr:hypothetical protein Btru_076701 [Bulinus truncatus]